MKTEKFDHLRNQNPGTPQTLELATITWIQSLPEKQRPVTLGEKFPRIANKLAQLWPNPAAVQKYLDELMFDDRGQRQGFPISIGLELATLKELVVNVQAHKANPSNTGIHR